MATKIDGSIVLSVEIDSENIKPQLAELQNKIKSIVNGTNKTTVANEKINRALATAKILQEKIKQAQDKTTQAVEKTKQAQENATQETKKTETSAKQLKNTVSDIANKLGLSSVVKKIATFSNKASILASEMETYGLRIRQMYEDASDGVVAFVESNSVALGMSKKDAYKATISYGNLFSSFANGAENAKLTNAMLAQTAIIASNTGRTFEETLTKIQSGILGNISAIDDLGIYVNQATLTTTKAFKTISNGRPWAQLTGNEQKQILTLAILEQSQKKYGNSVLETSYFIRSQFNAAWEDFKSTWGEAVNEILMPVLQALTSVLQVITALMQMGASVSEEISETVKKTEESSDGILDNQKEFNKELAETDKLTQNILAGFDDIQKLGSNETSISNGGSGGAGTDLSEYGGEYTTDWAEKITSTIEEYGVLIGAAGGMLVMLGLLLCLAGSLKLGVALVIMGVEAQNIAGKALSSGQLTQMAQQEISTGMTIVGIGLVVIGIMCCVGQRYDLGIAAIVAGVADLGYTTYLSWDAIKEKTNEIMGGDLTAWGVTGLALIVIGILCCVAKKWTLGVSLIVSGAETLVTDVTLNQDLMKSKTTAIFSGSPLEWGLTGVALVIIGILMCCVPGMWGLGLGAIAMGLDAIVKPISTNPQEMDRELNAIWNKLFGHDLIDMSLTKEERDEKRFISDQGSVLHQRLHQWGLALSGTNHSISGNNLQAMYVNNLVAGNDVELLRNAGLLDYRIYEQLAAEQEADKANITGEYRAEILNSLNIPKFSAEDAEKLAKVVAQTNNQYLLSLYRRIIPDDAERVRLQGVLNALGKTEADRLQANTIRKWLELPRYASGVVIPPNTAHLAIIGDQKKGYNIETPLDTMISAFNTALDSRGAGEPVHVHLYLDGKEIYDNVVNRNRANTRITGVNELAY